MGLLYRLLSGSGSGGGIGGGIKREKVADIVGHFIQ